MGHILKLLYMTWKNIKRNGFHNLIIIVFVITAVFFMNNAISSFRYSRYLNHYVETTGLYESYMYSGFQNKAAYYRDTEENMEIKAVAYIQNELEELREQKQIADYYSICEISEVITGKNMEYADVIYADHKLLQELSLPMAEGKWFDTWENQNEGDKLVPAVIGYNLKSRYRLGEKITIESANLECVVVGIMKRNALFINPNSSGSGMNLNMVTQLVNDTIIVAHEMDHPIVTPSFVIKLSEKGQGESETMVLDRIADVANTFTFADLAEKAYQDNQYVIEMQATLSVMALMICVIGMGCSNLLSYSRGRKRQAVYFLCGMDRQMAMELVLLEAIIKLFFPAAAGLGIFLRYCEKQQYDGMYVDGWNLVITILVMVLILSGTMFRTLQVSRENAALNILHT